MVAEGDGLGALEVGIAGHDGGGVCLGLLGQSLDEVADEGNDLGDLVAEVHTDIQSHLVVTASGGVELLAHVTQPLGQHLLHEHMDILAGHVDGKGSRLDIGEDPLQTRDEGVGLGLGNDMASGQHGGVGHTALDVLTVHTGVEVDGGIEIVCDLIGYAVGAACPHFCHDIDIPFGICMMKMNSTIIADFAPSVKTFGVFFREDPKFSVCKPDRASVAPVRCIGHTSVRCLRDASVRVSRRMSPV